MKRGGPLKRKTPLRWRTAMDPTSVHQGDLLLGLAVPDGRKIKRVETAPRTRGPWKTVGQKAWPKDGGPYVAALRRSTRLRPRGNPGKRRTRFLRQYGGGYNDWMHGLPCVIAVAAKPPGGHFREPTPCGGPMECDHEPTRGAGGTARDMNPMCRDHAGQRHGWGVETFQAVYGIDLRVEAARYWAMGKQFASVEALAAAAKARG